MANLMWGTDGVRVFTRSDDGWGWIFTAVESLEFRSSGVNRTGSESALRAK